VAGYLKRADEAVAIEMLFFNRCTSIELEVLLTSINSNGWLHAAMQINVAIPRNAYLIELLTIRMSAPVKNVLCFSQIEMS
jgi:hypothetical protein